MLGTSDRLRSSTLVIISLVLLSQACRSPGERPLCPRGSTHLPGSVCVDMAASSSLAAVAPVVIAEVERTLAAARPVLPIRDLRISIIADSSRVIPEIGLGGYTPSGSEVQIFVDPNRSDLRGVLERELLGILAHEMHHAMRRRSVGYGSTLFQAAVTEGLADHFSLEVSGGAAPPWATALSDRELATWMPEVLARSSERYDHPAWFFGATPGIPRWAGYSVGYELVRLYLATHAGALPSALVDEPASSFVP